MVFMAKQWKNLRKRVKVRLVNNAKDYKNLQANQVLFHRRYLVKVCCYSWN